MNPKFLIPIACLNAILVLGVVNGAILKKQSIVSEGQTVFLKLRPRDPRSLMQGDYMVLRYEIEQQANEQAKKAEPPTRGQAILTLDDRNIASVTGFAEGDDFLEQEHPLRYRKWRRGFRFGIESFFFEEGDAKTFDAARFAEVKLSPSGEAVLVGLHDEGLGPLKP